MGLLPFWVKTLRYDILILYFYFTTIWCLVQVWNAQPWKYNMSTSKECKTWYPEIQINLNIHTSVKRKM
jgi:hypothetical protein